MPEPDRAAGSQDPGRPGYLAVGMHDLPEHDDWLTAPEAERLQRFRFTKRRQESRLGRWTAKHALAAVLGVDTDPPTLRELVIRNAADGAPEVFLGGVRAPLHISMTDRADWAVCVVRAATEECSSRGGPHSPVPPLGVGCDLELVEPRSAGFVEDWFTPAERALVAAAPELHDLLANLVWSAKESALKVLRTGLRRDTRSVEVTLTGGVPGVADHRAPASSLSARESSASSSGPSASEWSGLRVATAEGAHFEGWWRRFDQFVLTYVSAAGNRPPAPLMTPDPLSTARPSHAWMADPRR